MSLPNLTSLCNLPPLNVHEWIKVTDKCRIRGRKGQRVTLQYIYFERNNQIQLSIIKIILTKIADENVSQPLMGSHMETGVSLMFSSCYWAIPFPPFLCIPNDLLPPSGWRDDLGLGEAATNKWLERKHKEKINTLPPYLYLIKPTLKITHFLNTSAKISHLFFCANPMIRPLDLDNPGLYLLTWGSLTEQYG